MSQPTLRFASKAEFEAWLEDHHADSDGIWVEFAKKGSGIDSVVYAEALQVALCFGWIDGQVKSVDETWYRQRWTPRRARSPWSKRNVGYVAKLIESGAMRPAGLAEVERAKADGRWDAAYDGPKDMKIPPDLQAEFDKDPELRAFYDSLNSTNRYGVLYRLQDAKRPETRARRLEQFLDRLRRREKPIG